MGISSVFRPGVRNVVLENGFIRKNIKLFDRKKKVSFRFLPNMQGCILCEFLCELSLPCYPLRIFTEDVMWRMLRLGTDTWLSHIHIEVRNVDNIVKWMQHHSVNLSKDIIDIRLKKKKRSNIPHVHWDWAFGARLFKDPYGAKVKIKYSVCKNTIEQHHRYL